jgi:hypothetical protein
MSIALNVAVILAIAVGLVHSFLGERYILSRLFRRDNLPQLFGGTEFTTRTLRFAWHITTIAWWGFAAILFQLANGSLSAQSVALATGLTFMATGLVTLVISRAKHLAWPVFLFIGCVGLYAATAHT